jgi:hypothetical protein
LAEFYSERKRKMRNETDLLCEMNSNDAPYYSTTTTAGTVSPGQFFGTFLLRARVNRATRTQPSTPTAAPPGAGAQCASAPGARPRGFPDESPLLSAFSKALFNGNAHLKLLNSA